MVQRLSIYSTNTNNTNRYKTEKLHPTQDTEPVTFLVRHGFLQYVDKAQLLHHDKHISFPTLFKCALRS